MRQRLPVVSVVICLVIGLAAAARAAETPPRTLVFIKAGRVLDVRAGRYLEQQGILIEGDRIKEVGPHADVERRAAGATVIDLGVATVLPGLIDGHGHLVSSMSGRLGTSENLLFAVAGMTASRRALLGAANAREALESGITTVRNLGHSGVDGDVALRDAIGQGWVPGPRMQAAARKITPTGGQALEVRREAGALLELEYLPITGVEEARRAVREDLMWSGSLPPRSCAR
jgi:imidazolonepropionase-like amidohydrolase